MRFSVLLFLGVIGQWAGSFAQTVPTLGSKVPAFVLRASRGSRQCDTGAGHREPCTDVRIKGHRLTIAWDKQTKEITFLFTDDPKLVGDSELKVGGSCRIGGDAGGSYLQWVLSPGWTERFGDWSGRATWYVALRRDANHPAYGIIQGFVQSRYIPLLRK